MCGAFIVPDLSANQVAVKAFKLFIMVNGFTHILNAMVIQVSRSFKIKLAERCRCQIKSVPGTHIKVREL